MFSLDSKIILVDNSLFTLGTKVTITEQGKTLLVSTLDPSLDVPREVAEIISEYEVNNVFVKGIDKADSERFSKKIDKWFVSTNFSKTVDKIHYHMI